MEPSKHPPSPETVDRPVVEVGQLPLTHNDVEMTCAGCREQFLAHQIEFMGVKLTGKVCPKCSQKIIKREIEQEELRRQKGVLRSIQQREQTWAEICPKEFRLVSESDGLTQLAKLELAQPQFKHVLEWKGPKGLLIRGATGTCKTRSVWRLVRRLYVDGKKVFVLTAGQFDRQCRDHGGNYTLTAWFDRLAWCDVFVLDDLGQGAWTSATEAHWMELVDERTREGRPIIVTTQHTGQTLTESASDESKKLLRTEAMIRRLRDYCETITFT